jgi:hypothetical protein
VVPYASWVFGVHTVVVASVAGDADEEEEEEDADEEDADEDAGAAEDVSAAGVASAAAGATEPATSAPAASATFTVPSSPPVTANCSGVIGETSTEPSPRLSASWAGAADDDGLPDPEASDDDPVHPARSASDAAMNTAAIRLACCEPTKTCPL